MTYEILKRLQWTSADETPHVNGLHLSELYEITDEKQQADNALYEALRIHGCRAEDIDEINQAINNLEEACELQGFINGWRMCAMLERELFGQSGPKAGTP
ncbi:MAG: hypothetical protein HDT27_04730 [Subdoligranulum sp.]|nr:hypothetical protein [Subdoligranulum sp.]